MLSDLPGYFIKVERTDSLVDIILQRAVRSQPNKKSINFGGGEVLQRERDGAHRGRGGIYMEWHLHASPL